MTSLMMALLALVPGAVAPDAAPAYQATMIRAAPGQLLELIETLKNRLVVYQRAGEPVPIVMRHAQGDHWDVLVLTPIGTMADHFSPEREARWRDAVRRASFDEPAFTAQLDRLISWREDLYVEGPPVAQLQSAATTSGYFHLEVFQALAGMRDSLLRQRAMENDYLGRIGRPGNLLFRRITGAAWDAFTLGFYRDLAHYAEPVRVTPEQEDQAAREAGFKARSDIGPYLRRFIGSHHDTLGSIVR